MTDLLPDFPRTSARAATSCFVEEVNVYEDAFASKHGGDMLVLMSAVECLCGIWC